MIYYLLLLFSVFLGVCKSALYNLYAKKAVPGLSATLRFNAAAYGTATLIALLSLIYKSTSLSASTLVCATLYAVIVFSLQTISIAAMRVGTMATTSICVMYGMIIPSLAGPIFWQEPFGPLQALGIAAVLVSLWFLNEEKKDAPKASDKKWWHLAVVAFLLSGMAGVMEKVHQSTGGREEKTMFVFIACLSMLLISTAAACLMRIRKKAAVPSRTTLLIAVPTGMVIGFYSIVNLTLAGTLDSMVYYPIANGGAMLLTVITSVFLFRESFDRRKIIGAALGLIGILCLSIS